MVSLLDRVVIPTARSLITQLQKLIRYAYAEREVEELMCFSGMRHFRKNDLGA